MPDEPDNLNPLLGNLSADTDISMLWAGYLFDWNDENRPVPELAVRVPTEDNGDISRDGLTIIYHLRRGVRWQDGAPFTADDVIYSWQQTMNPRNLVGTRIGYDVVLAIARRDDHTIAVRLKRRFAPFVATFFAMGNHPVPVLPRHILARYADLNRVPYNGLPIGTGPFRLVRYDRGVGLRFVANSGYWRGPPKLRAVEVRFIPDTDTLLTMAQRHECDLCSGASVLDRWNMPGATIGQVWSAHQIPGMRLLLVPMGAVSDIGFNMTAPALRDVRVRRALAYAVDRKAIVAKVLRGVPVAIDGDQPPFSWAYDRYVPTFVHDAHRAAALLDAAGWHTGPDGFRRRDGVPLHLSLVGGEGAGGVDGVEVLVQQEWRELGVDATIKNFTSAQLYGPLAAGGIEQSGKFDAVFERWTTAADPDDSDILTCAMKPPAGWNVYHFCNAAVDAAEGTALASYDQNVRAAAYRRIQELVAADVPMIPLSIARHTDLVSVDVHGYRPAHVATPFWNTWEWST